MSHVTSDFAPDAVASGLAAYNEAVPGGITARSHAQVTALLGGLPLVPPGVVPVGEWRADPGRVIQPADLYAALAATRAPAHQPGWPPAAPASGPLTDPPAPALAPAGGPPPPPPAPGPDAPDPEESLPRMLVLTGLLTAAGLAAKLNVTQDIPDITARLSRPGSRDIRVIIDDDGYIELRFWTEPGATPSEITTTLTRAITVLATPVAARQADEPRRHE